MKPNESNPLSQHRSKSPTTGEAETSSAHQNKPSQTMALSRSSNSNTKQQTKQGSEGETIALITNTKQTTQTKGKTQEINQGRLSPSLQDRCEEWSEPWRETKPQAASKTEEPLRCMGYMRY